MLRLKKKRSQHFEVKYLFCAAKMSRKHFLCYLRHPQNSRQYYRPFLLPRDQLPELEIRLD
jgi:hypothetical protein